MIIYLDVLVALNTIVTYFILLATRRLSHASARTIRLAAAALLGGFSSLYIFLPQQKFIFEALIKLLFSAVIVMVSFGFGTPKKYLRCVFSFFAVSFIYAGFMLAFWYVAKPNGMVINNGVVYFSISPIVLILSTVICYFVIVIAQKFYNRQDINATKKTVNLLRAGSEFSFECMVDTGNSISDPLGNSKIIILGKKASVEVFGKENIEKFLEISPQISPNFKYRLIPYETATGESILPIVLIDGAVVDGKNIGNVAVGILNSDFLDFDGIISPSFFD
ncbi:MAG: sigma-E processing peptidase SpoIIGA [Clostridia bacterium]|nr:sigma-E processing peptidase SpoIIGA [Clostridia bacterium]